MPRDLFSDSAALEPPLFASPESKAATPRIGSLGDDESDMDIDTRQPDGGSTGNQYTIFRDNSDNRELQFSNKLRRGDEKNSLHPYVQTLNIDDLESCIALENAAFPEQERCSREKFIYRLTTCPELSLGLFSSTQITPTAETQAAHDAARAPDSSTPSHRAVLIGQVIATLTTADAVTDVSMETPSSLPSHPAYAAAAGDLKPPPVPAKDPPPTPSKLIDETNDVAKAKVPRTWRKANLSSPALDPSPGHHALGRTLAVHSVCILPPYQKLGLGKVLMKAYLQRMESSGIADRIALIAHPKLVGYYAGCFGFQDRGDSAVKFAGGAWREMVYQVIDSGPGS